MKKNNYISLILLFVFSFVLAHNIIPHHHHDEVAEIHNHEHHHHDTKAHDHNDDDDEPLGLFSHSAHILASTEFIRSSYKCIQKTQNIYQYYVATDLVNKLQAIPIKRKPPNRTSIIPFHPFYKTHSLRGPPEFTI